MNLCWWKWPTANAAVHAHSHDVEKRTRTKDSKLDEDHILEIIAAAMMAVAERETLLLFCWHSAT